jgi:hypothetical protein
MAAYIEKELSREAKLLIWIASSSFSPSGSSIVKCWRLSWGTPIYVILVVLVIAIEYVEGAPGLFL